MIPWKTLQFHWAEASNIWPGDWIGNEWYGSISCLPGMWYMCTGVLKVHCMTNLRKQKFAISLSLERLFCFFLIFSLNYPQIYGQHREHINLYQMAPGRHVYSNKYQTTTSNRCILLAGCNSLIIHSLTARNESFLSLV